MIIIYRKYNRNTIKVYTINYVTPVYKLLQLPFNLFLVVTFYIYFVFDFSDVLSVAVCAADNCFHESTMRDRGMMIHNAFMKTK